MNNFEATLLFGPDLTAKKIESIEKLFEKHVTEMGGSLVAKENWGLRDLSYKIHKAKKAFYNYYQITFEGNKIQELKRVLSQNEEILRYLFIKVNNHEELPTKMIKEKE